METQKDNNDYTRRNRFTGESIELTKEEAEKHDAIFVHEALATLCLLYTSPSPRDGLLSRMPSSA